LFAACFDIRRVRLAAKRWLAQRRAFRVIGATAALLAIFFSAGGHWAALQSIPYKRMLFS